MVLATSLVSAARSLINTFGNDASRYAVGSATSTTNDEGETTVSNWGTATTIKVVDGGNVGSIIVHDKMGREQVGEDEKIVRDDVTIALNDRVTYNSKEYRVLGIRSERVESTNIIQIVKLSEASSTTIW